MKRIFITRNLPSVASTILEKYFEVHGDNNNEPLFPQRLLEIVGEYEGILSTVSDKFTKDVLVKSRKLEVISNYAAGFDNIDVEFAKSRGISVYNTPDIVTNSTADLTFALLLSLVRKIPLAHDFVSQDKWKYWEPNLFLGEELQDKTFGILGFGRVGQAVAKRAIGFGLCVIFYDPFVKTISSSIKSNVEQMTLDNLLKQSDYISIHVPLTKETHKMISSDTIAKMSRRPILLNLARGDVVATDDLVAALKTGKIRGAALDVTHPEPISGNHPLCRMDNCIVTPHIGTATKECRHKMAKAAVSNIVNHYYSQNGQ